MTMHDAADRFVARIRERLAEKGMTLDEATERYTQLHHDGDLLALARERIVLWARWQNLLLDVVAASAEVEDAAELMAKRVRAEFSVRDLALVAEEMDASRRVSDEQLKQLHGLIISRVIEERHQQAAATEGNGGGPEERDAFGHRASDPVVLDPRD